MLRRARQPAAAKLSLDSLPQISATASIQTSRYEKRLRPVAGSARRNKQAGHPTSLNCMRGLVRLAGTSAWCGEVD